MKHKHSLPTTLCVILLIGVFLLTGCNIEPTTNSKSNKKLTIEDIPEDAEEDAPEGL